MLSDKSTAAIGLRKQASGVESQPERSGMIAERVIGDDRLGNRIRLRRDPRIHMLFVIAVRPPTEAAILHRRQVIRHEIAAEFVALVHHGPERASLQLPTHAVGIATSATNYPPLPTSPLNSPTPY